MVGLTTERRGRARWCVTEKGWKTNQHLSPQCIAIALGEGGRMGENLYLAGFHVGPKIAFSIF